MVTGLASLGRLAEILADVLHTDLRNNRLMDINLIACHS